MCPLTRAPWSISAPKWQRSQISGLFSSRTSRMRCNWVASSSLKLVNWLREMSSSCPITKNKWPSYNSCCVHAPSQPLFIRGYAGVRDVAVCIVLRTGTHRQTVDWFNHVQRSVVQMIAGQIEDAQMRHWLQHTHWHRTHVGQAERAQAGQQLHGFEVDGQWQRRRRRRQIAEELCAKEFINFGSLRLYGNCVSLHDPRSN